MTGLKRDEDKSLDRIYKINMIGRREGLTVLMPAY